MSSRVTRSSARLAAGSSAPTSSAAHPPPPPSTSRKRKATGSTNNVSGQTPVNTEPSPPRRSKRQRVAAAELPTAAPTSPYRRQSAKQSPHMAKPGLVHILISNTLSLTYYRPSLKPDGEAENTQPPTAESSKRKSSRSKKPTHGKFSSGSNGSSLLIYI